MPDFSSYPLTDDLADLPELIAASAIKLTEEIYPPQNLHKIPASNFNAIIVKRRKLLIAAFFFIFRRNFFIQIQQRCPPVFQWAIQYHLFLTAMPSVASSENQ
ncbi:hypothetical protein ACLB1O_09230 [Escherichia coli]